MISLKENPNMVFDFNLVTIEVRSNRKLNRKSSDYSCPVSFLSIWMILSERILKNDGEEMKGQNET